MERMEVYYLLVIVFKLVVFSAHAQTQYGAGDTQIINYSSVFCESLEAKYNVRDSNISTSTLYILSEPPALSNHETFQFSLTTSIGNDTEVLFYYHFYQGSAINVMVCRDEGNYTQPKYVYLLKGDPSPFTDLRNHEAVLAVSVASLNITTLCVDGYDMLNYNITTEAQYHVLLGGYDTDYVALNISMTFIRSKYGTTDPTNNSSSIVIDSCKIEKFGNNCTVNVPLSKNYALLTYGTSSKSPDMWDKDVRINVTCNSRVWIWVAIFVPIILLLVLCVLVVLLFICLLRKCRQRKHYSSEMAPLIHHKYGKPEDTSIRGTATRKTLSYDKLTEMAITVDNVSNPHIISNDPNPPPSFTDHAVISQRYGSPTFSTFKPDSNK